jgi:hypothetical protein
MANLNYVAKYSVSEEIISSRPKEIRYYKKICCPFLVPFFRRWWSIILTRVPYHYSHVPITELLATTIICLNNIMIKNQNMMIITKLDYYHPFYYH